MGDILFLAHRIPYPPDRGDKIRSYHILRHLAKRQRVHLVTFADDPRDMQRKAALKAFTGSCAVYFRSKPRVAAAIEALLTRRPVSITAFEHRGVADAVKAVLTTHSIDTIFVFSGQMAQYLPARPRQRVVMDFVDLDSAKFVDYARKSRWPMSWLHRREAGLLAAYERGVASRANASLFVSEAEAQLFRNGGGSGNVQVLENGIDTLFYDPAALFKSVESLGRLIVFTGQMDYRPNIEAVTWFADAVMPHVRVAWPDARFAIVGRNPGDAVKALASSERGVIVTGEVADVRGWLAAAAVVVAPLKLARGVQNKVLEAMAMARAVVASPAAAEGVDHEDTIKVADSVTDMAREIIALLADPKAARALGEAARARVLARYGWAARLAPLDAIMGWGARA